MNVFADCPLRGAELSIKSGPMKGEIFIVEGWARDIMEKRLDWPSDMGNPAVLNFWMQRQDILTLALENSVECARVALTGLYGHVGWAGYLMLPEELGVDVTLGRGECRYEWSLADNGWADHTCSACGYVENTDVHVSLDWNYCPNCGARIEVGA